MSHLIASHCADLQCVLQESTQGISSELGSSLCRGLFFMCLLPGSLAQPPVPRAPFTFPPRLSNVLTQKKLPAFVRED